MAQTLDQNGNMVMNGYSTNLSPTQVTPAISAQSLTAPAPAPIPVTTPNVDITSPVSAINSTQADISGALAAAKTEYERQLSLAQGDSGSLANLQRQKGNQAEDLNATNAANGVNSLFNQLQDINARSVVLKNEATAIPIANQRAYQGSAGTQSGVDSVNRDQLSQNALKMLSLGQEYAIASGNYEKAKNYADQYITAKYAKIDAEIEAKKTNLKTIIDLGLTPAQQKLAEVAKRKLDFEEKQNEEKKVKDKEISNLIIEASPVAPKDILAKAQAIQSKGGSATEVALALGQYGKNYLANEKLKLEIAKVKKENYALDLKNSSEVSTTQKKEVDGWVANINSGKAKLSDVPTKLKSAVSLGLSSGSQLPNVAKLEGYTTKLNLINDIAKNPALTSVVGPSAFGRIGYTYNRMSGEAQDFTAKVDQLTKDMTLQNLIDAKAKGATFGALSEGELKLLSDSATRINSYRKEDGSGHVYYDVNEQEFKDALNEIQDYTQKAYEREGGVNGMTYMSTNPQINSWYKSTSVAATNATTAVTSGAASYGFTDNQK